MMSQHCRCKSLTLLLDPPRKVLKQAEILQATQKVPSQCSQRLQQLPCFPSESRQLQLPPSPRKMIMMTLIERLETGVRQHAAEGAEVLSADSFESVWSGIVYVASWLDHLIAWSDVDRPRL